MISGVVVYLAEDAARAERALAELEAAPALELGPPVHPRRRPAVLEAASAADSKDRIQRLEALEGVERVEVTFVSFEPEPNEASE